MSEFNDTLKTKVSECEGLINSFLPKEEGYQKKVIEAMNYSIMAGGKRLRPMLMLEFYRLLGGRDEKVIAPFMAAMEMIHTYSLVHDDLPAMDNDEYRRGRKTTHIVYGPGMATLAGDGLLNYAFETALKAYPYCKNLPELDDEIEDRFVYALHILSSKAGIYGMVGGQCADIECEGRQDITSHELLFIHENKTGALIEASMMIGAVLSGADKEKLSMIEKIGSNVGIAFQIQDDILDVEGDESVIGKPVGSDEKNEKVTYVTLHGMEASKQEVKRLSKEAESLLEKVGEDNKFLSELIEYLISRNK
ncbi:MAG: polyprenyl synthetase family protein [Butyrivibrio sp.]|nr:polyprenyl synthetase family protein [Butyrivibrio sp.]